MRHPAFSTFALSRCGFVLPTAAAMLLAGAVLGAAFRPEFGWPTMMAGSAAITDAPPRGAPATSGAMRPVLAYRADVVRVIDGDTFEARVHIWPGLEMDTKVRLRDIDGPELHARCAGELARAEAARAALQNLLAGEVTLSRVGIDKYGGRVDAAVATREVADVSAALLNGGYARSYAGGRRGGWC